MYNDNVLYKSVHELIRMKGRNIGPVITVIWNEISMIVNMDKYHPKGDEKNQLLGRAASMQRLFIDMQNLCTNSRNEAREDLDAITKRQPRTFEELNGQKEEICPAVRAVEMACGEVEGSKEADAMRTYLGYQLNNECARPYENQAHRLAMNSCMEQLQKDGERNPGLLTIHKVFTELTLAWRRIGIDRQKTQSAVEEQARTNERAMIAAAAQIITEGADGPWRILPPAKTIPARPISARTTKGQSARFGPDGNRFLFKAR